MMTKLTDAKWCHQASVNELNKNHPYPIILLKVAPRHITQMVYEQIIQLL